MPVDSEIARELGSISATVEHIKKAQEEQGKTLSHVDERLHKVETRSAINGAVTGGVMAAVMATLINLIKISFK